MAEGIKIQIYRNETADILTKKLADPEENAGIGSAAAASAALSASMVSRAAVQIRQAGGENEKLDWYVRNTEILRSYMVKLIDEDVKCRGPLRKARKDGDERTVEAAMQPAAAIANEIVNMMHQLLELLDELAGFCAEEGKHFAASSADLAMGAICACQRYLLDLAAHSSDETYRYIVRRENQITLDDCRVRYDSILAKTGY